MDADEGVQATIGWLWEERSISHAPVQVQRVLCWLDVGTPQYQRKAAALWPCKPWFRRRLEVCSLRLRMEVSPCIIAASLSSDEYVNLPPPLPGAAAAAAAVGAASAVAIPRVKLINICFQNDTR